MRRLLPALAFAALWLAPAAALAHKDDYLADTFVFVTLARRELELEYWIDARFDPRGGLHTFGAEYGLTDHLMGDVSGRWFQRSGGPFVFEQGFFEIRYRFGEEGDHFIDPAASIEYEVRRSEDGRTHRLLEPRAVLSRDFGEWNVTLNLFYARVLDRPGESAFEAAAGVRSSPFGRWSAGVELRRELALDNETRVIPQVWYRFTPEAYLKAGVGKNLAGEKDTFARVAVEIEF
jgi:hypothetical protein